MIRISNGIVFGTIAGLIAGFIGFTYFDYMVVNTGVFQFTRYERNIALFTFYGTFVGLICAIIENKISIGAPTKIKSILKILLLCVILVPLNIYVFSPIVAIVISGVLPAGMYPLLVQAVAFSTIILCFLIVLFEDIAPHIKKKIDDMLLVVSPKRRRKMYEVGRELKSLFCVCMVIMIIIVPFFIMASSFTSRMFGGGFGWGHISPEIIQMSTTIPLNFSEVQSINVEEAKIELNKVDMGFKDVYEGSKNQINYWVYYPMNRTSNIRILDIGIYADNATNESHLSCIYSQGFDKSELEDKKAYLINKITQVANICNITVNTTNIQWQISYND